MHLGKEAANLSVEGSLGCRHEDQGVPLLSPFSLNLEGIGAQTCTLSVSPSHSLFIGMAAWTQRSSWSWADGMEVWQCGGIDIEVRVEAKTWDCTMVWRRHPRDLDRGLSWLIGQPRIAFIYFLINRGVYMEHHL